MASNKVLNDLKFSAERLVQRLWFNDRVENYFGTGPTFRCGGRRKPRE